MNDSLISLNKKLIKFNLELSRKQLEQIEAYANLLSEYNKHTNLVSAKDIDLIYDKHLYDSFSFSKYFNNDISYNILDIGSGGGFPVIPLSIVMEKSSVTALDATRKKTDFLKNIADKLELSNISVINARAENIAYDKNYREKFDIVTSRAVGNLAMISELSLPFVKIDGYFYAYKASKAEEELKMAELTIKTLGGEFTDIFKYDLNMPENYTRNLLKIKKIEQTDNIYPRSFSVIKNHPIKEYNENIQK